MCRDRQIENKMEKVKISGKLIQACLLCSVFSFDYCISHGIIIYYSKLTKPVLIVLKGSFQCKILMAL